MLNITILLYIAAIKRQKHGVFMIVDENDPAFNDPTKPIGPFYSEEEAKKISEEKGYVMKEDEDD